MSLRILSSCCLRQLSISATRTPALRCNARFLCSIPVSQTLVGVSPRCTPATNLQLCRYKSKGRKKNAKEVEEEDEDAEEGGDDINDDTLPGEKEQILRVGLPRVDKVLKMAIHGARKIEEAFLEGKIYKNESKLLKKSVPVQEGDVLDLELGPDGKNPDFVKVHRVKITEIKEGGHAHVKILVSRNLTIKRHSS